jgi:hypothetical protein
MPDVKAFISGGHVYCQLRHEDRDVTLCFGCERLKELDKRTSPPYIVCDLLEVPEIAANDPQFIEWWYQHHRRGR